jgi:hypothetical protein
VCVCVCVCACEWCVCVCVCVCVCAWEWCVCVEDDKRDKQGQYKQPHLNAPGSSTAVAAAAGLASALVSALALAGFFFAGVSSSAAVRGPNSAAS